MSVSEEVSALRIQVQELEGEEKMMLRELEKQAAQLQKAQAEALQLGSGSMWVCSPVLRCTLTKTALSWS